MPYSSYSHYRGQSVGRILHCLSQYCDTYHRLCENACVDDGKITYHGEIIAYYSWPADKNDDVPAINFVECKSIKNDLIENFNKNQRWEKPFLDEQMPQTVAYLVQEIRKIISLEEALSIKFIRDKWDGDWEQVSWYGRNRAERVIRNRLRQLCERWSDEQINKYWKHLAMCAIYDI